MICFILALHLAIPTKPSILYNLLTYEALAHYRSARIMGDGNKLGTGIILNTQSFSIKECVFVISILIYKFDLSRYPFF